jgi:ABC-type glutathione transport system ATPase component
LPLAKGRARNAASHLRDHAAADPCPEPAIAVDRLVKVYKTTRAVDGISFALERGSITGLLGGNGAGKTTTIAMIMGLVPDLRHASRCSAPRCRASAIACCTG